MCVCVCMCFRKPLLLNPAKNDHVFRKDAFLITRTVCALSNGDRSKVADNVDRASVDLRSKLLSLEVCASSHGLAALLNQAAAGWAAPASAHCVHVLLCALDVDTIET